MDITITTHPVTGAAPNLTIETMTVTEQMSELFSIEVNVITDTQHLDAKQLLGTPVDIEVTFTNQPDRVFNGLIRRISAGAEALIPGTSTTGRKYRIEVVPKLWFLTQRINSRVFQNQRIEQILTSLFSGIGFTNSQGQTDAFTFSLSITQNSTDPLDFALQYSESDFNFVSRLLEHRGIYYFFEHQKTNQNFTHGLTIADHQTPYKNLNPSSVAADLGGSTFGAVTAWNHDFELVADSYVGRDFNDQNPSTPLESSQAENLDIPNNAGIEIFEYPGGFASTADGNRLAGVRIDTEENKFNVATGESRCTHFFPGAKFTLQGHPVSQENGEYLLTRVVHHYTHDTLVQSGEFNYTNSFECIPSSRLFYPERKAVKPLVQGPQTAKVVGPAGQNVYVDNQGRVKVQFHWDRVGQNNENSSAYLRVSQSTAGLNHGNMFVPRIGDEVVVSFLEGDPDKPLITGSVYNSVNGVPFNDTDSQGNKSILKNRNGMKDIFGNEIYLDSTPGEEHIKLHSPNYNSGITLGKNKVSWSSGDQETYLWGSKYTFTHGSETSLNTGNLAKFAFGASENIILGANIASTVGAKIEPVIGTNVKMIMGQNYEVEWGIKRKFNWAHEFKKTQGNYIQAAEEKIIFDSEGEARLIGGDQDNSILTARKEGVFISHGQGEAGINGVPQIAGNATKATMAAAAAVVSVGALGASAGAASLLGQFEDNGSPVGASQEAAIGVSIGAGIATVASFAVAYYLQKQIDKQFKDAKDASNQRFAGPANEQRSGNQDLQTRGLYSSVELNKRGLTLTAVKGPAADQGNGEIALQAESHMFLGATENLHLISAAMRAEAQTIELRAQNRLDIDTPEFYVNGNLQVQPDANPNIQLDALNQMQQNLEDDEPVVGWWEWLTTWN